MTTTRTRLARTGTAVAATAAVSLGSVALFAAPAHADYEKEKDFRVAGVEADFNVELEHGRYDVDFDLDDARPGSRWRVVLKHNGTTFHNRVHRADADGDVDVDTIRPNSKGKDRFTVKVVKVGSKAKASRTITMR